MDIEDFKFKKEESLSSRLVTAVSGVATIAAITCVVLLVVNSSFKAQHSPP